MNESDDSDFDDDFEDALEVQTLPSTMDLATAICDCKVATHYFFNNKFYEAQEILKPWVGRSMYHTMGNATFNFLEAILTFERKSIERASASLKLSIQVCNHYRKKVTLTESLGKIVKKTNYDTYTADELHAELCFAESLLLKSLLTFIEDETLVSFIKAGLKIRSCYNSYKKCMSIVNSRHWAGDDEPHRVHFESGVRMGIGLFNLMISLLPGRVIRLLEFIGFSGSKERGLAELHACYAQKASLRHVHSVLTLLSYNLIIKYFVSQEEGDLQFCDKILNEQLAMYPDGAWFLYLKGRLELIRGNVGDAVQWYHKSWRSQNVWPQFHHICYWELLWCNCMLGEWKQADMFASYLLKESKWSRTTYAYQKAAILMMDAPPDDDESRATVAQLMANVPRWKQRIAGKSLPIEKFAVRKAERYANQNGRLVLPAFELLYVWNYFKIISKRLELCDNAYRIIEHASKQFASDPDKYGKSFANDNKALILLLKGSCLRHMSKPLQAEQCFDEVISMDKCIEHDTYLVPYALYELALVHKSRGDYARSADILENAKKNYSGYSLETRLHFLVHSELSEMMNNGKQ